MAICLVEPEVFGRVGIRRHWYALPAVLCVAWPLLYYGLRIRSSTTIRTVKGPCYLAAFGLIIVPYLLIPLLVGPRYLRPAAVRTIYEVSQFAWLTALAVHSLSRNGRHNFVTFFAIALVYGVVLENGGIMAGYFAEPSYHIYLGGMPAPAATMAGWAISFYCMASYTSYFGEIWLRLKRSVLSQALLTTALALSLDLFLDPVASLKIADNAGLLWHWNPKLPPFFLGEPIINWVAWFSAILPFSYAYFLLAGRQDLTPGRRNLRLLLCLPLVLLAAILLNLGIMAVHEGGFGGPTFEILRDFRLGIR